MKTILSSEQALALTTKNQGVKPDSVTAYTEQAEALIVKPALGDDLYIDLVNYVDSDRTPANSLLDNLLDGGEYTTPTGKKRSFAGLLIAIAYLSKARYSVGLRYSVTDYGSKLKESAESSNPEPGEIQRDAARHEAVGLTYLNECKAYAECMLTGYSICKKDSKKYLIL